MKGTLDTCCYPVINKYRLAGQLLTASRYIYISITAKEIKQLDDNFVFPLDGFAIDRVYLNQTAFIYKYR